VPAAVSINGNDNSAVQNAQADCKLVAAEALINGNDVSPIQPAQADCKLVAKIKLSKELLGKAVREIESTKASRAEVNLLTPQLEILAIGATIEELLNPVKTPSIVIP